MITVKFKLEDGIYTYLSVKGHANAGKYGQDLVCASVSSIMFGLMNAIDMANDKVMINDLGNHIQIINDTSDPKINNYLELTIVSLRTIEESYSQYLKIDERR